MKMKTDAELLTSNIKQRLKGFIVSVSFNKKLLISFLYLTTMKLCADLLFLNNLYDADLHIHNLHKESLLISEIFR